MYALARLVYFDPINGYVVAPSRESLSMILLTVAAAARIMFRGYQGTTDLLREPLITP